MDLGLRGENVLPMLKVGFGIIGCGGIAFNAHIPSIEAIEEAEVVAVSRRSKDKAREAAQRCGLDSWYTDNQKVIDHPDVNAVIICTPPNAHAEWTIKAAAAGKHALCENSALYPLHSRTGAMRGAR